MILLIVFEGCFQNVTFYFPSNDYKASLEFSAQVSTTMSALPRASRLALYL